MDETEIEQFDVLASNWREAEEAGDEAASQAFEDELHARITVAEIGAIQGLGPKTGEPSLHRTEHLRTALAAMWNKASARLD